MRIGGTGTLMPTSVNTKILHYIVYPSGTLDAVYNEHGRQIASLRETLRALRVSELDVTALGELDWPHAADRVVRERIRHGCPVHHRSALLEIFAACDVESIGTLQSERNIAQILQGMGVKVVTVLLLVGSDNSLYLLADRLAIELEKLGHKATYQTVRRVLQEREFATLAPT